MTDGGWVASPVCGVVPKGKPCDQCGKRFEPRNSRVKRCKAECIAQGKQAQENARRRERYAADPVFRAKRVSHSTSRVLALWRTDPEYRAKRMAQTVARHRERYAADPVFRAKTLSRTAAAHRKRRRERWELQALFKMAKLLREIHDRSRQDQSRPGPDAGGPPQDGRGDRSP